MKKLWLILWQGVVKNTKKDNNFEGLVNFKEATFLAILKVWSILRKRLFLLIESIFYLR